MNHFLASLFLTINVLTAFFAPTKAIIPVTGDNFSNLPPVTEFSLQVSTGVQNQISGLYLPEIAALPVVQQPSNNPGFVSEQPEQVTQFAMASQYGSTGILAHNYLAGSYFFQLRPNQLISLTFGDGRIQYYRVQQMLQYQAINPLDPYTNFVDLQTNEIIDVTTVFTNIYAKADRLVLQTCIEANGDASWGRLFVIAEPFTMDFSVPFNQILKGSVTFFNTSNAIASN